MKQKIEPIYSATTVKEIEYYPNGKVKRVVFKSAEEIKKMKEIFPNDFLPRTFLRWPMGK